MKPFKSLILTTLSFAAFAGQSIAGGLPGVQTKAASEVEWLDTPFGVQASPVFGDFTEGKHITFIKFKAGTSTPPHIHTHDYTGIVVQGRGVHYEPSNNNPIPLPAGSFWSVRANAVHISGCLEGEDCIFALSQDASFDYLETKE